MTFVYNEQTPHRDWKRLTIVWQNHPRNKTIPNWNNKLDPKTPFNKKSSTRWKKCSDSKRHCTHSRLIGMKRNSDNPKVHEHFCAPTQIFDNVPIIKKCSQWRFPFPARLNIVYMPTNYRGRWIKYKGWFPPAPTEAVTINVTDPLRHVDTEKRVHS